MDQPRWLELAWADLGVAEAPGAANNPRVVRYYADAGHPEVTADEVAWCAAFVGACLERAGVASTRSLMARSYLAWGEALDEPRTGAIAVLSRGSDPSLGHVGFLIGAHRVRRRPARRQPGRCRLRAGLPALPPGRPALARWRASGRATPPVIPDGAPAPIRDPGHRRRLRARPRPRARDGGRLRRRPLRSRRPHQPRHHARRVRARQGDGAHRPTTSPP